ncbi:MAG: HGGxSTG domain-containing protein [Planctomycetota bacterium]
MQREKKTILLRNGNPQGDPNNAPRYGAKTRKGTTCRAPAMSNGRCRMHDGKSTDP